jgi:hypothetical protein
MPTITNSCDEEEWPQNSSQNLHKYPWCTTLLYSHGYFCSFFIELNILASGTMTSGVQLSKSEWQSDCESLSTSPGSPREILQDGTRLLWGHGDRLRLPSKLRIWGSIKPLVNFHKCFISCAAECPDNIYRFLIQSSDKHNQLMQQGVTCWSYFIVPKIWSTAIKIIYQFFI